MSMKRADVSKDRLYEEFNTAVTETEQLLKSVGSRRRQPARCATASLMASLRPASGRQAAPDALAGEPAADATDDYVHSNPWRAIGIAAAVSGLTGLVAGLLIARR